MLNRWSGMAISFLAACSVPDVAFTRLPADGPPDDDGDDVCEPTCATFSTVRACPTGAADRTCGAATPLCKAGACVALTEVSFGTQVPIFSDDSAGGFGLVDVDADGHLDLIAALVPAGVTDVSLGDGARSFGKPAEIALRKAVFFGDLNHDGKADLIILNSTPALDSYLGDGLGHWTIKQAGFTASADAPTTGKLADLDEDGNPDFVFVSSRSLIIHYGKGDGAFEPLIDITTVTATAQVVVGDVDGDGHPDLVVRENAGSIETFRRTAPRVYAKGVIDAAVAASDLMSIADFDGDGKADLVTTTAARDKLAVMNSVGDGTYGAPVLTAASMAIRTLVVGDVNGDGVPDVAIVQSFDSTDQTILALVGRGDRTFKTVTTDVRDTGIRAAIQAVDITGTGKTDLFYMSSSNGAIRIVPSL